MQLIIGQGQASPPCIGMPTSALRALAVPIACRKESSLKADIYISQSSGMALHSAVFKIRH